ncbi:AAA ATPase domain [Fusarium oxysporum f. sp. vasinfectum]|nr:AAA ATPase domain [Fusarium oxysporum f. sp. vasinfectum]
MIESPNESFFVMARHCYSAFTKAGHFPAIAINPICHNSAFLLTRQQLDDFFANQPTKQWRQTRSQGRSISRQSMSQMLSLTKKQAPYPPIWLYFFLIGIGRFVVCYTYSSLYTLAAYRITRNIRCAYLEAGLRQEIAFSDSGAGGSVAMQATSNGQLIQTGISEKLGLVVQAAAAFVAAFVLALTANWKLALITCCIGPVALLAVTFASFLSARNEVRILAVNAQAGSFVESVLSSAKTIHAFGLQARLMKDLDGFLNSSLAMGLKNNPVMGCWFSTDYFIHYAGIGLCFWQSVNLLARGEVDSPGDVFTVLMSIIVAVSSITAISPSMIDFTRAAASANELFKLIDRKSSIDPFDASGETPPTVLGHITVDDIIFSYPSRPDTKVLDGFSLDFPAGKSTALVGASGSGKSTIVALLERWYNPSSGSIKLDGRPIESLNLQWLRQQIRIVQQEPVLFSGTIYDNIANGLVGSPWENDPYDGKLARIQEAAKNAFAHDFITDLPQGYDTIITERGGILSGGQRQRIAIARSIISEPMILLLDEATSALDPHAEQVVQQALNHISKGRTTITIAHKLATIRGADNIAVVEKGRVIEQGTHGSLLAREGPYSRLVKAQDLAVAVEAPDPSSESPMSTDEERLSCDLNEALTRHSTTQDPTINMTENNSYDNWKPLGIFASILRLLRLSPEFTWHWLFLCTACFLAAAAYPGQAILMSKFIDVFHMAAYFAVGWFANSLAMRFNHKFRKQIVHDILRQDIQFFDLPDNAAGALASRTDSVPTCIYVLMGFNIAMIIVAMVSMLSCSILSVIYAWKLGLVVALAGLPPLALGGYIRIRMEGLMEARNSKKLAASASISSEALTSIRTVASLSIEKHVLDRYARELDQACSESQQTILFMMLPFAFTQTVEYCFLALGFWYGCRLLSFGEITQFEFFVAFLGVYFSGQKASMIFASCTSITSAVNSANYIFWLSQLQPSICEDTKNSQIGPSKYKTLAIDGIHFSYPSRPQSRVLRGVELSVEQGQFIALVGASGCGKSTMISILERFYDPSKGKFVVDDVEVKTMNPWLYRRDIALVQQEPVLYSGSIRHNISFGVFPNPDVDIQEADIVEACRAANVWDFICSLPEGLDTNCGVNGTQLSGGQRQRIAIARALIRKPRLLLLDEATSALDTQSERIVQEALNNAAASDKRITIAVAHRLSTIRNADMICVFQRGVIIERGTHGELLALDKVYKKMCESQNMGA